MWDTPFDLSMLREKNVIISCPQEVHATELMQLLEANGVLWRNREAPTLSPHWHGNNTCYWIDSLRMAHGTTEHAEHHAADDYANHIFCYFGGTPDFDTATEEDFKMLFS